MKACVELSTRYINDRFLPDKAIDLMDEAASRLRMKTYMEPESFRKVKEEIEKINKEKEEAIRTQDFEKAHQKHKEMGCICFENDAMGIYFINDPDNYWLEIVPAK